MLEIEAQEKQDEWSWQWERFGHSNKWLFEDWIYPNKIEDFRGKFICDAGCGPGHHIRFVSPYAERMVAVDLNTPHIAKKKNSDLLNVEYVEADLATFSPAEEFDALYCIGVVHHTNDPDRTVKNLRNCVKPGGRIIFWVYSEEGNALLKYGLNPIKSALLSHLPRSWVSVLAHMVTAGLYLFTHTVYCLPLKFLPFYEYFQNWRHLKYFRNHQNVFDHMNSPKDFYIPRHQVQGWMDGLEDISISSYLGISWRASGSIPKIKSE